MPLEAAWEGQRWQDRLVRTLLFPASWLYAMGWLAYEQIYRWGLKKPAQPHRPIICVGNLRVGGTGKTPTVLAIARLLLATGREVVIGCSGYGSPRSEGASVAPEGQLDPGFWGDEPTLLREALPTVPLVVGRDRVKAATLCHEQFPKAILLMDDGFQHLRLKTDVAIVLDPPGANHHCLPAGPYREPASGRRRASTVIPGEFRLAHGTLSAKTMEGEPADWPDEADLLTAIAQPNPFIDGVRQAGVRISATRILPDHDPLTKGNLFEGLGNLPLIVTAKDAVKLRARAEVASRTILVAHRETTIEPADAFSAWLGERLGAVDP